MKKKIKARTITLISLIGALICAVLAGFALINLDANTSTENSNYITKPEHNVSSTVIDDGYIDDGYDDWYDENDSYYYQVKCYRIVYGRETLTNKIAVNQTLKIVAESDDYTARLQISGVAYETNSSGIKEMTITPTEIGDLYVYVNSENGSSNEVTIRVHAPVSTYDKEYDSDTKSNYWYEYELPVMKIGDTQTIWAVTDNKAHNGYYYWNVYGTCGELLDNSTDNITVKAVALGDLNVTCDFGQYEISLHIEVTSDALSGFTFTDNEYDSNAFWMSGESHTMKVGETQTIYYCSSIPSNELDETQGSWVVNSSALKIIAGGNGYDYITVEAVKAGYTVSVWEDGGINTELIEPFKIKTEKGDYDMSDVSWNYSSAFTYDGNTKTVSLTGLPKGVTANYSNNSKSAAGTYTASVSSWNYDSTNYNVPSSVKSLSWTINRASINAPTLNKTSVTYSQSSQTFTISSVSYMTVTLPTGWSRSGTTITIPSSEAVGSYSISVTPDSNHKWSDNTTTAKTLSISITAASVSSAKINLSQTSFVYTSQQLKPTVTSVTIGSTTVPSSDYTVSYSNNINVGTATVTITAKNNYKDTCSTTFTITKATPTAIPTVAAGTYISGNPLSTVGITGTGSVSGTFYWADPSTLLTLGSASYEWTFEPTDTHNYNTVTGKATVAAVGMDNITVTGAKVKYKAYESFTTTGMVVNAVASGVSRPVTGYTLTIPYEADGRNCFLVSDNGCEITVTYTEGGKTATAKIVITVEKADYNMSGVSMTDKTVTYDGTAHSITYMGELPTGVHFNKYTYDGADATDATNAGTYSVVAVFTVDDGDNYNVPTLTATLVINKATPTATVNVSSGMYYVGDGFSGVVITVGTSNVGGTVAWTNASGTLTGTLDSYSWTFVPTDTVNYNNATGTVQVTAYYKLTGITVTGAKTTYKAHESFDTTGMVVTASYATGKSETAVTGYTITYPTAGATEFVITDNGKSITVTYSENGKTATAEITITIDANEYDMSGVTMNDLTVTYDGAAHSIIISGALPTGVTVTGYKYNEVETTGATNAGTYEVEAIIVIADPDNYLLPELKATLIINKAQGEIDVTGVKTDYTYNGALQTVNNGATVNNSEQSIVYTNNTFTTVAEGNGLEVSITVAESTNYLAASATVTLTVNKATPNLDVTGVQTNYVYTGALQTIDSGATVDNAEQTVFYSNNTFTTVIQGNGMEVKISVAESANYLGDSKTVTITVEKATVENSVTFTDKTVTYDGAVHYLTVDGALADDITVTYLYNGTTFNGATNVDSYEITVHFECTSGNYYDPSDMTATLTIDPYTVTDDEVTGIKDAYAYQGAAWKPEPIVTVTLASGSVTLKDYALSYSTEDYTAGTTVTVTLEFSGNFAGTITKEFTITKAELTIEWSEGDYEYNGKQQGAAVIGISGLASTDSGISYTVTYTGRGNTSYNEVSQPINAGQYAATVTFDESIFDNYEFSATNALTKNFEIRKADVTVSVGFTSYDPAHDEPLYAGSGLPEIEVKGNATAGELIVQGTVAWSQVGSEPLALELGEKQYAWIFTPNDTENFNVTMDVIRINAIQAVIKALTAKWRDGAQPVIYTSTTLSAIREYLLVEGELAGNNGTVEIVGYTITGSWGAEPNPAADKAGTYYYTISFNGNTALLPNVVYSAILIIDLQVEAATSSGITKTYNGLDEFDRESIKVTVVYNDGTTLEVQDYDIIYNDGHDRLWAGDRQVVIAYNNGSLEEDMQRVIDGLTVYINTYDMSGITIGDMTTDYDG